jgi:hypothetical protein
MQRFPVTFERAFNGPIGAGAHVRFAGQKVGVKFTAKGNCGLGAGLEVVRLRVTAKLNGGEAILGGLASAGRVKLLMSASVSRRCFVPMRY